MNKQTAIKAIENGATLHINHNTDRAHICVGAGVNEIKSIRLSTAESLSESLTQRAHWNGVSVFRK